MLGVLTLAHHAFCAWRCRRTLAKLDAALDAQRVALGNALMPSLLKWFSDIEPITSELVQLKSSYPKSKKRNRNT